MQIGNRKWSNKRRASTKKTLELVVFSKIQMHYEYLVNFANQLFRLLILGVPWLTLPLIMVRKHFLFPITSSC
jgi:hypothetical protein